ncbi:MAG: LTA synthase family protein [Lachnospiraceae bacterium]|nr:LTA synthase family protein [Lachnospiraceae bacterium]
MNKTDFKNFTNKLLLQLRMFATECLAPAVLINLCIEGFSRESVILPFLYFIQSPLIFLYNTLLICATLSLSFLFKRRKFARFLLCALWVAIGVTDFVLLQFRTTPFTAVDLLLLDSAFAIMGHYLSVFQIILVVLAILLVIGIGIFLFLRTKKETEGTSPLYAGLVFGLLLLTSFCSTKLFVSVNILERNFGNLAQGFHTNGLPYCFFTSIFETGISKPASYSEQEIDRIVASITKTPLPNPESPDQTTPPLRENDIDSPEQSQTSPTPESPALLDTEYPNFIFLQLESFFDPTLLSGASFSEDPVPTFRKLKETYSSGYLTVPSIGAGTANTEFELLTGINLDFFGPGEYPYKTVLKDTVCESIAYNLSALGLTAHALHNNDGTFYGRNTVFSQLGFHTFTPIEYMGPYETTPLGWAKDRILTTHIMNALSSTEGQDFVYAISVQGHGAYPETALLDDPAVAILSLPEEFKDSYYEFLYFVNQLKEMDTFLSELISALENYEEEIVLVLYGDHLPSFPFSDELMTNGSVFETEYVIWTNRPNPKRIQKDLEAYALSSHVLNCNNIHEGLFTRFHQTQAESETYLEDMELLAYDILYGEQNSYEGELPYHPTTLQFGLSAITLQNAYLHSKDKEYLCLHINGENFTPYSIAYINDKQCATTYINPQQLSVTGFDPEEQLTISVAQVGADSYPLSFTEPIVVSIPIDSDPAD